jgi:hypothetical protein
LHAKGYSELTCVQNYILTIARAFIGFITFADGTPAFFNDNSQITTTVQNGFAAIAILVADGMIVGTSRPATNHTN